MDREWGPGINYVGALPLGQVGFERRGLRTACGVCTYAKCQVVVEAVKIKRAKHFTLSL
jgi:hypothetical protein